MTPVTRKEQYYARILGESAATLTPVTREEIYLDSIAGETGDLQEEVESLGSGFTVKGVVESTSDLPDDGELGDLYLVSGEGYDSYVWNGTEYVLKGSDTATAEELLAALYA